MRAVQHTYAKPFFDLQLRFAEKVAAISGLPLAHVLMEYTNLYIRFGLGREFQQDHPVWQEYLAGLQNTDDSGDWTYRFYLSRAESIPEPSVAATFGCFSYALLHGDRIRLHFRNAATEEHSSLSSACQLHRRGDLTALFSHAKQTLPQNIHVVGVSWLYNIVAYRRLFPASYIATASVLSNRFKYMPLWGQFLGRHGNIKESMARPFLARLEQQVSIERLQECFPFQVLTVEAALQDFYYFYGIETLCSA
jgi:hypothetical protein